MNVVAALATATVGLALLFGAWCKRLRFGWLPVSAGWGLLALSGGFWVAGTGAELGITLLLFATPVVAWLFVAGNRQRRQRRARLAATPPDVAERRPLAHHLCLFVLVVPLAAVASALLSVALSLALPVSEIDAMVAVLVAMPLLWGCAAYWAVADPRPVRPALVITLSAVVGGAIIYV